MDRQLLRHSNAARAFIGACVVLGAINALLVIAQAWLIAVIVSDAFDGRGLSQLRGPLVALLAVVAGRAVVAWGAEVVAGRSSPRAKSQLRSALLSRLALDPGAASGPGTGAVATLGGRGIDALDAYYSLYLPQRLLAVIVPIAVVVALFAADWISGVIVAITLPLIPVFMALVGATTRDRTAAQTQILERLAGHFLDVSSGLPTLKVFGAAKRADRGDCRGRRPPPGGDARDLARHVPVLADARTAVNDLCCDGRGRGGITPTRRGSRSPDRTVRAGDRARRLICR